MPLSVINERGQSIELAAEVLSVHQGHWGVTAIQVPAGLPSNRIVMLCYSMGSYRKNFILAPEAEYNFEGTTLRFHHPVFHDGKVVILDASDHSFWWGLDFINGPLPSKMKAHPEVLTAVDTVTVTTG